MWIARLRSYVNSLLHRSRREAEIADELQFHVESRTADLEREGLAHAEALRRARVEFGAVEKHRAAIRASLGLRWMDELGGDLRYAWRMLWRSKGFTAVAIGSLALGIGANTIIFSMAKGVLLDRLAVPHPEQLRLLTLIEGNHSIIQNSWGNSYETSKGMTSMTSFPYPVYQMLQQQNREHPVMRELFAFKLLNSYNSMTLTVNGRADVGGGQIVSGNYYQQLGVKPQVGRGILPSDDGAAGTGNVVVISDSMWAKFFGRSPDAIGKTIEVNLIPMTIVGVNPPEFTGAASVQVSPDVFFPFSMQPLILPWRDEGSLLENKELWWVQVMGRSLPRVPNATAESALQTWLEQDIRATSVVKKGDGMPVLQAVDGSRGIDDAGHSFTTQMYVLLALTGFVLLLACANLANLLLARSAARQREMAVRLALGASRGRVLRQVLTESLLLSSIGGAAGLLLGYEGRNVIPHMYSASWMPSNLQGNFDLGVLAFTIGISLLTGVVFGLAPAWQATRTQVNAGLKDTAASTTRQRKGVMGRGLVIFQVALSMLLVVGAGLFASTLRNLSAEKLGFDPHNLLMFSIQAPAARYAAPKDVELHQRIEQRLAAVPGVRAVTLTAQPVLAHSRSSFMVRTDEETRHPGTAPHQIPMNSVGDSFFSTYHIPILFGRGFETDDTASSPLVAVISRAMAQKLYPNSDPVGRSFDTGFLGDHPKLKVYRIIGVAEDAKYDRLQQKPPMVFYNLYRQLESSQGMTYEVKTILPPGAILPSIRAAVAEIDKDLPLSDVRTQEQQIAATISQQKTFAVLTSAFGVLALVLACIGIYGLMAYDVARRTNEIGIRMALGARTGQMLRMVLGETSWLALAGIGIGLGATLLLTKYVKSMLYGVTATDPWTLAGAGALLLIVALLAGFGPARHASRVEPMEALRHE